VAELGLGEPVEQRPEHLGGHTLAIVADRQHCARRFGLDGDLDRAAIRGVANGVVDQVG